MLHLAATLTLRTGLYIRTVLGSLPVTVGTWTAAFYAYLLLYAVSDLFECKGNAGADVAATVYTLLILAAASTEVEAAKASESSEATSEDAVENIVQIAEALAEVRSGRAVHTGKAVLIVTCLLVRIAED